MINLSFHYKNAPRTGKRVEEFISEAIDQNVNNIRRLTFRTFKKIHHCMHYFSKLGYVQNLDQVISAVL